MRIFAIQNSAILNKMQVSTLGSNAITNVSSESKKSTSPSFGVGARGVLHELRNEKLNLLGQTRQGLTEIAEALHKQPTKIIKSVSEIYEWGGIEMLFFRKRVNEAQSSTAYTMLSSAINEVIAKKKNLQAQIDGGKINKELANKYKAEIKRIDDKTKDAYYTYELYLDYSV